MKTLFFQLPGLSISCYRCYRQKDDKFFYAGTYFIFVFFPSQITATTAAFCYFHGKNNPMKKINLIFFLFFLPALAFTQSKDESAVRKVLAVQTAAWNEGSIDRFMRGYWQNDSLQIIGQSG